jgi:hypothetical protein
LRGSFGQLPRLDAEMNCSENFTPRLRLWSTVRRDVLNIEFSNQWTRRRSEVVFESVWRDVDAVKEAFGDGWQQSYLPEGYSVLITAYSVHHFLVSENSTTK